MNPAAYDWGRSVGEIERINGYRCNPAGSGLRGALLQAYRVGHAAGYAAPRAWADK